ncbi:hypothetical protein BLOT_004152 [Blomia tropicalis]|nr:hypothetical protein BLOT_004152 [Blomia tropicalis]
MRELSLAKLFDISKFSDQLSTNRQIQTDEYNRSMLQFLEIYPTKLGSCMTISEYCSKSSSDMEKDYRFNIKPSLFPLKKIVCFAPFGESLYGLTKEEKNSNMVQNWMLWAEGDFGSPFKELPTILAAILSSHLQFLENKWEDILKIIHHKELNLHLTEQENNLLLGKPANFKVENLFLKIKGKMVNVFKAAIRHKTSGVGTKQINKQRRIRLVYCSHVKISIIACAITK